MRILIICFILVSASCVSTQKHTQLQGNLKRLQNDSALLEKRIQQLQYQVGYLETKNASTEQTLTQRLQEKEDSLNQKQQQLTDREVRINDMKARKAQEQEAFAKLSQEITKPFASYPATEVACKTTCTQTAVEVSDRILFIPTTSKADAVKAAVIFKHISDILAKQPDLKVMVINHTDSVYAGKEKWDDNWSLGAAKANAIIRLLVKDYKISPQRITPGTQAEFILPTKTTIGLGRARTTFLFYSELLPCMHVE
jgi:chemotaxis protein MotB